jgi:hypothetical protein
MTLRDVLKHLDTDFLLERKENVDDMLSGEVMELEYEIDGGHDQADEDVDSVADSKESSRNAIGPVTVLSREECKDNDILKIQELLLSHLYDQNTSPIKFNKVNGGKVVNKVAALQILQYAEEHHMSRSEAEDYLKSTHKLIECVTGKPFDMVHSFKTLQRSFLYTLDKKLPLSQCEIHLPKNFFQNIRTRSNKPLPSLKASFIPVEVAIGTLLLKMSPDDLVHNMKAEYWRETNNEGVESVERIYTNWCSGKYAIDLQKFYRDSLECERVPIILQCSIFVDGGAMGSNSRSATQVSIAVQNVRNTKFQSLIGFVPEENALSSEVLEGLLEDKGINKTSRKFILQTTDRQREYDYLHAVFTPFMERQDQENGFDVQVGTGDSKRFYRVFVVFTNFLADSPQMHRLTGVSNSACHLCMCKNFADFRINGCDVHGRNGTIFEQEIPRDIVSQYNAGREHMNYMAAFINKEVNSNTRPVQTERKKATKLLKSLNGYSGANKVFSIFRILISEGVGTMNRLFGSDLLHTWTLGFVEACVGFSLQIIKYIGHPNVDTTFSQSPKILLEIIQQFPAYNSLQPAKRHISFKDIWELFQSSNSLIVQVFSFKWFSISNTRVFIS